MSNDMNKLTCSNYWCLGVIRAWPKYTMGSAIGGIPIHMVNLDSRPDPDPYKVNTPGILSDVRHDTPRERAAPRLA